MKRQDFIETWPFTVDSGTIICVQYESQGIRSELLRGVVFEAAGRSYGLNGTARSRSKKLGYSPIEDIWAVDTAFMRSAMRAGATKEQATLRENIGPMIDLGLSLCQ